jgi:c-di-GMP-binding flagellar brake protein YcgR/DNA-binding NarL/FixJ family response regulator
MKTIIIIENGNIEQESVSDILSQSSDNFRLLLTNAEQALSFIAQQANADLIIYDLSSQNPQLNSLSKTATLFAYIPCIVIIDEETVEPQAVLNSGCSLCLARPLKKEELHRQITEQLDLTTSGQVRGIPIHSLLQMLESDEKTCTLKLQAKKRTGLIFVEKGVVVAAETGELESEDAVYAIITWEDASVELRYYNGKRPRTIQKPLISLIMEGFRLKDERDSLKEKQESEQKPKLELKHISTAGNRISLEIGAKIKMEFNELDTPLVSTMVGMVQDKYLLVTPPNPFSVIENAMASGDRIIIKYLHMGRICMFRTKVQKAIDDPHPLLFLDYPPVIHYHELRRAKRTSIFIPCTLVLSGKKEFSAALIDLSGFGCLCQIRAKGNAPLPSLAIDSKVHLRCLLPGLEESQQLTGIVKNFKTSSTEARTGLAFSGLPNHLREVIEGYVATVESINN